MARVAATVAHDGSHHVPAKTVKTMQTMPMPGEPRQADHSLGLLRRFGRRRFRLSPALSGSDVMVMAKTEARQGPQFAALQTRSVEEDSLPTTQSWELAYAVRDG